VPSRRGLVPTTVFICAEVVAARTAKGRAWLARFMLIVSKLRECQKLWMEKFEDWL